MEHIHKVAVHYVGSYRRFHGLAYPDALVEDGRVVLAGHGLSELFPDIAEVLLVALFICVEDVVPAFVDLVAAEDRVQMAIRGYLARSVPCLPRRSLPRLPEWIEAAEDR